MNDKGLHERERERERERLMNLLELMLIELTPGTGTIDVSVNFRA